MQSRKKINYAKFPSFNIHMQSVLRFFYLFISRIEKNSETEKSRWNETREKHCTGEPSVDSMFVLQLREQQRFFFKQNRGGRANLA